MSRQCFLYASWMFRWYLGDVSVMLWWYVKMFSICASDVSVVSIISHRFFSRISLVSSFLLSKDLAFVMERWQACVTYLETLGLPYFRSGVRGEVVSLGSTPFVRLRMLPKSLSLLWQGRDWRPNTLYTCATSIRWDECHESLRMVFACNPVVFSDLHCWLRPLMPTPMMGRPRPWLLKRRIFFFVACHGIKMRSLAPRFWMRSTVETSCPPVRVILDTVTVGGTWPAHIWLDHGCGPFFVFRNREKSPCCGQLVYVARNNRISCCMCFFQALAQKQSIVASQDQADLCLISIERKLWKKNHDFAVRMMQRTSKSLCELEATLWTRNQQSVSCDCCWLASP